MKREYSTKQRTVILDFLRQASTHTTAKDILSYLKNQNIQVSSATVYRTLEKLEKEGIVRKMSLGDGLSACYQYTEGASCQGHFHLKCIECGELIHLSCEFLDKMEKHIYDEHSFTISSGKTVIYGRCAKCAGNSESAENHHHHNGCKCR